MHNAHLSDAISVEILAIVLIVFQSKYTITSERQNKTLILFKHKHNTISREIRHNSL